MKSVFSNHSTFLNISFNNTELNTSVRKKTGDNEFMEWMSSINPMLLSRYPTLRRESQLKLKTLHSFSLQADGSVDEFLKTINRCEQDYAARAEKTLNHLELLGLDDDEDFSCETLKLMQEAAATICQGAVGDGSEAGAASALASDFLHTTNIAKLKLGLSKDIRMIHKRNERLRENLQALESECKMASEEMSSTQNLLEAATIDLNVSQAKQSKLNRTVSSARTELDDHGVSPAISNQTILDTFTEYNSLRNEIKCLEGKFRQYGELPPSITQASEVVQSTKERLESVSNDLKVALTAAIQKRS